MGVHGSLKEANAHMDLCVNSVAGGKLCWDNPRKPDGNSFPPEYRRAMVARADGGSTVIAIQGWDIRRAKRAKKAAAPNAVLAEALDAIMDEPAKPTRAMIDLVNGVGDSEDAPNV